MKIFNNKQTPKCCCCCSSWSMLIRARHTTQRSAIRPQPTTQPICSSSILRCKASAIISEMIQPLCVLLSSVLDLNNNHSNTGTTSILSARSRERKKCRLQQAEPIFACSLYRSTPSKQNTYYCCTSHIIYSEQYVVDISWNAQHYLIVANSRTFTAHSLTVLRLRS